MPPIEQRDSESSVDSVGSASSRADGKYTTLDGINIFEVASYVEQMLAEMAALAHQHGLNTLSYFLEMARMEAQLQCEMARQDQHRR